MLLELAPLVGMKILRASRPTWEAAVARELFVKPTSRRLGIWKVIVRYLVWRLGFQGVNFWLTSVRWRSGKDRRLRRQGQTRWLEMRTCLWRGMLGGSQGTARRWCPCSLLRWWGSGRRFGKDWGPRHCGSFLWYKRERRSRIWKRSGCLSRGSWWCFGRRARDLLTAEWAPCPLSMGQHKGSWRKYMSGGNVSRHFSPPGIEQ